jgi:SAM-dependent methyltransferase
VPVADLEIGRMPWNHNIRYEGLILRSVPHHCHQALEVGCGAGLLAKRLADLSSAVIGMDVDHRALLLATRPLGKADSRVHFVEADLLSFPFSPSSFDFITMVATLHQLPLRPALAALRELLRPAGTLAIVGLYRHQTATDFALDALAVPTSWVLRGLHGYFEPPTRKQMPKETLREIRRASADLLPGAVARRRLLFRYLLIWKKPL